MTLLKAIPLHRLIRKYQSLKNFQILLITLKIPPCVPTPPIFFRTLIYAYCKSDLTETTSIPPKNLNPLAARILQGPCKILFVD